VFHIDKLIKTHKLEAKVILTANIEPKFETLKYNNNNNK